MQIKTITYKENRSLGNYQSASIEMTAEILGSDDIDSVVNELKRRVYEALYPESKETGELQDPFDPRQKTVLF